MYLVSSAAKPVAAVVGGNTGEDELAAAGFSLCPVEWDLMVEYSEIRQALALLPHMAKKGPKR
ncbi:MAG TPA: hypothetical protein VMY40_14980 [Anaerolineae bacterium]|nr:hypothetical protein [Anaerolineae bacterium]